MEEIEGFEKFHDEIIFENAQLKSKLLALEDLVNASLFLLFDEKNFKQLIEESIIKESRNFDEFSLDKEVYNRQNISELRRRYLLDLKKKLEQVK